MERVELSEREKSILRYVIHQFILTANPVGSRLLSKKYDLGLSPASIRNIMADLEESGLLGHPHTSAGRVPTDLGYRIYVDSLMEPRRLGRKEIEKINTELEGVTEETEQIVRVTASIISDLTHQLACVTYPKLDNALLEKIQIFQIENTRLLVVVTIKSGVVKTITLEINAEMKPEHLDRVQEIFNERLSGLKLSEIRNTLHERVKDKLSEDYKPIVRLFLDSVDKIFADDKAIEKVIVTGAKNILKQPEFENHDQFQSIIELIEDREVIVHIMDKENKDKSKPVDIRIGTENMEERLTDYSLITKEYTIGEAKGSLGIVGPKRMEYSKMVATVVYVANLLSEELKKQS